MAQSFAPAHFHIVYGTRRRENYLTPAIHTEFAQYITTILQSRRGRLVQEGGMPDHIHVLADIGRQWCIADHLREMKSKTSPWIAAKTVRNFGWQGGYAAIPVGPSHVRNVASYILHQEEHHRHKSFQEECEEMLRAAGLAFDPRYLWAD